MNNHLDTPDKETTMTYPKILQIISNPVNDNIQKLAELFPSAVKDGELDIDALKQELGEFTEAGPEKYELTWAGKQQAKQIAFEPIVGKTLQFVSEDSKQPETTENLFIEGDNLEVLKLLRQNYYGAVKVICIDPPYNTGKDFVYNDNFRISKNENDIAEGNISQLGEKYTKNRKDQNRYHTNWLNMIYPRLKLARNILKDDGVIFISIDENEVGNLEKIVIEIFGEENYLGIIPVIMNLKGNQDAFCFAETHEYIAVACKDKSLFVPGMLPVEDEELLDSWLEDEYGLYKKADNLRATGVNAPREKRPNLYYPIFLNRETLEFYVTENDEPKSQDDTEILPINSEGDELSWYWGKKTFNNSKHNLILKETFNGWQFYRKQRPKLGDLPTKKPKSVLYKSDYSTSTATTHLKNLFNVKIFDGPKPVPFIIDLFHIGVGPSDIIIDFFAGSATTAHATMQLNAEDGGNRKYIMVQLPEPCDENSEAFKAGYKNICEIGKERIRRAGEKILEENKDKDGIENLDIGFKVFRVADTNINWLHQDLKGYDLFDHYDKNASDKDKLDFMPGFTDLDVVYEIMLRQTDIPLSSKVVPLSDIGSRTYMFADSFVVCLEQDITRDLVSRLAAIEPLPVKFVFRDSAFDDNIALKDETFRRLNALIEKNSGGENPAYIVEFI
jgi:adenine-specific DNA-methyltransferase